MPSAGRTIGFSDHQTAALSFPAGVSSVAPWEIHERISRISSPVSGPPDIGMRGGSPLIIFTIKLSSGLAGDESRSLFAALAKLRIAGEV